MWSQKTVFSDITNVQFHMTNLASLEGNQAARSAIHNQSVVFVLLFSLPLLNALFPALLLGQIEFGKNVNVAPEDFWLLAVVCLGFIPSFCATHINRSLFLYFGWTIIATILGLSFSYITSPRATLYVMREMCYLLLFFSTISLVKALSPRLSASKIVIQSLLVGLCISTIYGIEQLVTGNLGASKQVDADDPLRIGYYGVRLLGFYAPVAVANLSNIWLGVSLGLFLLAQSNFSRASAAIAIASSLFMLFMSMARTAVAGGIIASFVVIICVFLWPSNINKKALALSLASLSLIFFLVCIFHWNSIKQSVPSIVRLTGIITTSQSETVESWSKTYAEERQDIHEPIIELISHNPVFGYGKSVLGTTCIGIETWSEAHNYFLRITAESGLIGLLFFLLLLGSILSLARRVYSQRAASVWTKVLGLAILHSVVSTSIASVGQDAFLPIKSAIIFWFILGIIEGEACQARIKLR